MQFLENKIIGLIGAACTSFGFFPQIIKAIKSKKLHDISWGFLSITLTGIICWLIYGVLLKDLIIIIANSITGLSLVILIFLKIRYNKNNQEI